MARPRKTHCIYGHELSQKATRQKCDTCNRERARQYSKTLSHEHKRNIRLKHLYNLTQAQWNELFKSQGSCCAICRSPNHGDHRTWHTDHDHVTGKVRGILCRDCNHSLGHYEKIRHYEVEKYLEVGVL